MKKPETIIEIHSWTDASFGYVLAYISHYYEFSPIEKVMYISLY
jgi:hypothetical protein